MWRASGGAIYNTNYHLVWTTKHRRRVLHPPASETLTKAIVALCEEHGYTLLALKIVPDHVHVVLSVPPKVAPATVAKILKGASARILFAMHPELKQELPEGRLWNPIYLVATAGRVRKSVIQEFVEAQKPGGEESGGS